MCVVQFGDRVVVQLLEETYFVLRPLPLERGGGDGSRGYPVGVYMGCDDYTRPTIDCLRRLEGVPPEPLRDR
jgi:hypothetical protein